MLMEGLAGKLLPRGKTYVGLKQGGSDKVISFFAAFTHARSKFTFQREQSAD